MSTLTLADAKAFLNDTSSADDAEIQTFIDVAESMVAQKVGPLSSTSVTRRVQGGAGGLLLPVTPVISLTSITPVYSGATAVDLTNLSVDAGGLVTYIGNYGTFPYWSYDVVYLAGRTSVPNDLLHGVRTLLRHLWRSQQGAAAGLRGGGDASVTTFPWAMPNAVMEIIGPYVQAGVA